MKTDGGDLTHLGVSNSAGLDKVLLGPPQG